MSCARLFSFVSGAPWWNQVEIYSIFTIQQSLAQHFALSENPPLLISFVKPLLVVCSVITDFKQTLKLRQQQRILTIEFLYKNE